MEKFVPKPNKGALFSRGYDKEDPGLFHYQGYLDADGTKFELTAEFRQGANEGLNVTFTRPDAEDSPFDDSGGSFTVSLARNVTKRTAKAPEYTASFSLNDVDYALAAWVQVSQAGRRYLSLKIKPAVAERWIADDSMKDPLLG